MNMNRIINMVIRMVIMNFMRLGMKKGMNLFGKKKSNTPSTSASMIASDDQQYQDEAPVNAKVNKQKMRAIRRMR